MRILEEFRYGNIEPTEYGTSSCTEYKKLLELICRNEEKRKATMTDEQKELFEKYSDCVREYQIITDCLIFQSSFTKSFCRIKEYIFPFVFLISKVLIIISTSFHQCFQHRQDLVILNILCIRKLLTILVPHAL